MPDRAAKLGNTLLQVRSAVWILASQNIAIVFFDYRVISNDADRFKRFCFLFFLSTNTPFLGHASRVSVAILLHLCHPNSLGPFSLHRFGAAHQTSLRSPSTRISYAISPEGGGSPNQSDGDFSHHNAVQAFPHRQHRFSVASVHDDRTLDNRSGPAT